MLHTYEFWFVVGSQFLYGPEVLETVAARAAEMADKLNASGNLPCKIVYKVTAKTNTEISDVVREAGVEPARPCEHWHLKPASLPIPPLARMGKLSVCFAQCRHYITISESGCQVLF